MSLIHRIQKLLFTEYSDFEEHVLLECPFAQTTKDGFGIQQLQIGITPTKLIFAKDYLEPRIDPACKEDLTIGTLELVKILPVELVNLSVYRRKTRRTIRAQFCNQQVLYFELASSFRREMFWNLWCERLKFLCPEEDTKSSSSLSGSKSSAGSLLDNGRGCTAKMVWKEKDVYLGKHFTTDNFQRTDSPDNEISADRDEMETHTDQNSKDSMSKRLIQTRNERIHRFGAGIEENCVAGLYLSTKVSLDSDHEGPQFCPQEANKDSESSSYRMMCLAEEGVRIWERWRHQGRPGRALEYTSEAMSRLIPSANNFAGFGNPKLARGDTVSYQMKRSASEVHIRNASSAVKTPLPRRILKLFVSTECLCAQKRQHPESKPIRRLWRYNEKFCDRLFWTTENSCGTPSIRNSYKWLRRHLGWPNKKRQMQASYNSLGKQLKMDISVSSWDFDSTILSYQLTLIDRDLFLAIPPIELRILASEKTADNAPYLRAMMQFAERTANLIVTEIVRLDSLKMRARLIGRYINVADKLHRLHNMHSTHSVLNALAQPAVHRMTSTWTYIRKCHGSKYNRLQKLLTLYGDVRTPNYGEMVKNLSGTAPYLPAIQYLLFGLIGHLPYQCLLGDSPSYHSVGNSWRKNGSNSWRHQSIGCSIDSETTRNMDLSGSDNFELDMKINSNGEDSMFHLKVAQMSLKIGQRAASAYDLIKSLLATEFLLKAKYLEPKECFFFSLKVEPNEHQKYCQSFERVNVS